MIINYTKEKDFYLAQYLAETTGDQVFYADYKINSCETSPMQSEKPYVLIADYDMLCKAKSLFTMGRTEFLGSKILYVVFVNSNERSKGNGVKGVTASLPCLTFAKSICAVKGTVLFGCACVRALTSGQEVGEEQIETARRLGSLVRDCIPFDAGANNAYPMRCKLQ